MFRRFSLARNAFPSRFVRDWARSFDRDRFLGLLDLDVAGNAVCLTVEATNSSTNSLSARSTDVSMSDQDVQRFIVCLRAAPALQKLSLSHNTISLAAMRLLAEQLERRNFLQHLEHLECEAITADSNATALLIEALARRTASEQLRVVDLSGNPLGTLHSVPPDAPRPRWSKLTSLKLACESWWNCCDLVGDRIDGV